MFRGRGPEKLRIDQDILHGKLLELRHGDSDCYQLPPFPFSLGRSLYNGSGQNNVLNPCCAFIHIDARCAIARNKETMLVKTYKIGMRLEAHCPG